MSVYAWLVLLMLLCAHACAAVERMSMSLIGLAVDPKRRTSDGNDCQCCYCIRIATCNQLLVCLVLRAWLTTQPCNLKQSMASVGVQPGQLEDLWLASRLRHTLQ